MGELSISQLIKIILGVVVFVVVVVGIYLFFKGNIISFFENIFVGNSSENGSQSVNVILGILNV